MKASDQSSGRMERPDESHHVSANECQAVRFLFAEGYSISELSAFIRYQEQTLADHAKGRCSCPDLDKPKAPPEPDLDRLREARMSAEVTQTELAERLGIVPATVSTWETGRGRPGRQIRRAVQTFIEENTDD